MRFEMAGESADDVCDVGHFGSGARTRCDVASVQNPGMWFSPFGEIAWREVSRLSDDEIRLLLVGAYPRVQKCSLHIRRLMPQPRQRVEFGDTKRLGTKSQMRGTLGARGFEQLAHSVESGWQA